MIRVDGGAAPRTAQPAWLWHLGIATLLLLWWAVYRQLPAFADAVTALLPVDRHGRFGQAVAFFLYDAPKVLMLLTLAVFVMGVLRSFFSAERTRALLAGRRQGVGNLLAALLGIVTPFCSCSAVPLFVGFVSAGVPLGVTFSFLVSAPMVNEVALALLFGLVGWQVAAVYLGFGLAVAVVAGFVIGRLGLEGWLEDWVRELRVAPVGCATSARAPGAVERYRLGFEAVRDILARTWTWVLGGIAVGALIHGYVPETLMASIMGADAWWSVPAAVILGIPMYANAAGIMPVVEALLGKGAALGTVLAFMMSVTALSLPEMILLRRVLPARLIAVFVAILGCGIVAVGFLFNAIL
jgi:uncharacterized membrane protein YraQ (UPF0718 family)